MPGLSRTAARSLEGEIGLLVATAPSPGRYVVNGAEGRRIPLVQVSDASGRVQTLNVNGNRLEAGEAYLPIAAGAKGGCHDPY